MFVLVTSPSRVYKSSSSTVSFTVRGSPLNVNCVSSSSGFAICCLPIVHVRLSGSVVPSVHSYLPVSVRVTVAVYSPKSVPVTSPPRVYAAFPAVNATMCGLPLYVKWLCSSSGLAICVLPPLFGSLQAVNANAKMKMRLQCANGERRTENVF